MSTLIGVRSLRFVTNEMKLNDHEKILWTVSQCVLRWLKQKESKDAFVRNRVLAIKDKDDITFRYIYTKHNPADLSARGMPIDELKESKLWSNGPEWLLKENENGCYGILMSSTGGVSCKITNKRNKQYWKYLGHSQISYGSVMDQISPKKTLHY